MKNKVCIVISSLKGGGAQRVVSNLSYSLSSSYKISIVLHDDKEIIYPYSGDIISLNTPATKSIVKKITNFYLRIIRLRRIKMRHRYLACISFMENSNFINILSGACGKKIISIRNFKVMYSSSFWGKINSFLIRYLYRRCDCIVVPSAGIKRGLEQTYKINPDTISVINNPYDIDRIANQSEMKIDAKYKEIFEQPVIITVGRLDRQKGQWHLIRAFSKVIAEYKMANLVIIGEGYLEGYLQKVVSEFDLLGKVFFLGYQENPFVYIKKSSLFVLPSLYEGFPNVLVEAMVCGLPVIATDCQTGPREILAPDTSFDKQTNTIENSIYGILTPSFYGKYSDDTANLTCEEDLLADAMIEMLSDNFKHGYYAKKAKERSKDFSMELITKLWCELIDN
jgi:glycosyltransferase involved in cell wall biosynthesis